MIATMILLLMLQLQNLGRVALVLATAPLGLIGAVAALLITDAAFGFVALLGVIALAGMIMRNTIILVDQVQQDLAAGHSLAEAIVESYHASWRMTHAGDSPTRRRCDSSW